MKKIMLLTEFVLDAAWHTCVIYLAFHQKYMDDLTKSGKNKLIANICLAKEKCNKDT